MKFNGLEKFFETMNNEIIDFEQVDKWYYTPLLFALDRNKSEELNLDIEQFNYLIIQSNLSQTNYENRSVLMHALENNQVENLNLTSEQWDYLFKNSDLKQVDKYGRLPLMYALRYNKEENLNLSKAQWSYLIENSDLSLITKKTHLMELKKIQSELLNDKILTKIDIKGEIKKNNKI